MKTLISFAVRGAEIRRPDDLRQALKTRRAQLSDGHPYSQELLRCFQGERRTLLDNDPSCLSRKLTALVREEANLWPLIEFVQIRGPVDKLRICADGLLLVDTPGIIDGDIVRAHLTHQYCSGLLQRREDVRVVGVLEVTRCGTCQTPLLFLHGKRADIK